MEFNFSESTKGIFYLIGGLVTLSYTLGWFQVELRSLMLAGAILITAYGFIKSGLMAYFQALINSTTNKK